MEAAHLIMLYQKGLAYTEPRKLKNNLFVTRTGNFVGRKMKGLIYFSSCQRLGRLSSFMVDVGTFLFYYFLAKPPALLMLSAHRCLSLCSPQAFAGWPRVVIFLFRNGKFASASQVLVYSGSGWEILTHSHFSSSDHNSQCENIIWILMISLMALSKAMFLQR